MRVELGAKLIKQLQHMVSNKILSEEQLSKVYYFIDHVKNNGFDGLEGRNKDSSNVPAGAPNYSERVKKAKEKKWWHYHAGIEFYDTKKPYGDRTSEYIIHYANFAPYYIRLCKLDYHPPFMLPKDEYFKFR